MRGHLGLLVKTGAVLSHPSELPRGMVDPIIVQDPNADGQQYYLEGKRKDCPKCRAELQKEVEGE